jgi:hypothetical protein
MPLRYISNTVSYEEDTTIISPSKVLSEHQYVLKAVFSEFSSPVMVNISLMISFSDVSYSK